MCAATHALPFARFFCRFCAAVWMCACSLALPCGADLAAFPADETHCAFLSALSPLLHQVMMVLLERWLDMAHRLELPADDPEMNTFLYAALLALRSSHLTLAWLR